MSLIKRFFEGFLIFVLIFIIGIVFIVPIFLDFMEIEASINIQISQLELATIVNNSSEMQGSIKTAGIIIIGLIGGILYNLLFFMINGRKSKTATNE
ncbi:hypothetical protein [Saliterribacillus persicus]|uniref:Uncharacterized protein n=1 Tax=Saliterribacillus persicus TaxID=930114 RepID=A0A368X866_9BACI|nr:hypothetical protein [Saliterribacillus persicus]RCW62577.1 hypothetical protein DFR57_12520 [Saliterribacillus persicus]